MDVHRDSQLDMFAKASPAMADARGPSRRRPSPQVGRSDEDMARALEESGNYRILRKLAARPVAAARQPGFSRLGVILDTETTGLNYRSDEIIEIGAVAFTFNDEGVIGDVVGIYGGLQQPSRPIPPDITRLTGITDVMVEGQLIDMASLSALIQPADLIIAHNAGFDRPFCEAFSPIFAGKAGLARFRRSTGAPAASRARNLVISSARPAIFTKATARWTTATRCWRSSIDSKLTVEAPSPSFTAPASAAASASLPNIAHSR